MCMSCLGKILVIASKVFHEELTLSPSVKSVISRAMDAQPEITLSKPYFKVASPVVTRFAVGVETMYANVYEWA